MTTGRPAAERGLHLREKSLPALRLLRRLHASWRDHLAAADPGLIRLRLALRTTTAVALTFAVLHSLALAARLPGTIIVLGLVESLFGSVSVHDSDTAEQRVTLLLTPLPAAAAFALGTVLAPCKVWGDLAFLAIIFAAVHVRRFGPRATALGFLAFIPYFFGSYMHLPPAHLPYQMLSLAVGTGCAYLVRFHVVPEDPDGTLGRLLRSFDDQIARLLAEIERALAAGAWNRRRRRRLSDQIGRLSDTALIVEDRLDPVEDGPGLSPPDRLRLRLRVFDLELAADRLAVAALRDLPPAAMRPALGARLASLRDRLRTPPPAAPPAPAIGAPSPPPPPETAPQAPGRRFAHALAALEAALDQPPEPGASAAPAPDGGASPQGQNGGADGSHNGGLRPTTRQAIQVTIACALAVVAGEILSPQRWYWAVLTAFVVFSGTQSRGETIVKAGQRVVGTVLGVAVGIGVADAVADNTGLALLLIYLCVFLAYYLFPVAHGAMMFWISIVVALLYRILGIFTQSLLLLRIEETTIGAVIGVLVAVFLLPTRTSTQTADALRDFLRRLGDVVEGAARHMAGEGGALDLPGVSRDLYRAFQTLRTAARPLASGLAGAVARTAVRRFLVVLRACGYYARDLARLSEQQSTGENPELSRALIALAAGIRRAGGALTDLIARGAPIAARRSLLDRAEAVAAARYANDPRRQAAPDRQAAALYDADHIDAAIRLLCEGASRGRRRGGSTTTAAP